MRKIDSGAYVRFRGKDNASVFSVLYLSNDYRQALCLNCWGGRFWHPIAGLKLAY